MFQGRERLDKRPANFRCHSKFLFRANRKKRKPIHWDLLQFYAIRQMKIARIVLRLHIQCKNKCFSKHTVWWQQTHDAQIHTQTKWTTITFHVQLLFSFFCVRDFKKSSSKHKNNNRNYSLLQEMMLRHK